MRRPTKCPICGNKIVKVTNAVTKNSYFKCSNEECLFVLGEEYTDAEFYLQGQTLKATCLKCNKPLTIVNGPNGLYPRCTKCSCDFEPTFYNGKMYSRWVNARRTCAKEEIAELIKNFNLKNADDELYDFEAFVASAPVQKGEIKTEVEAKKELNMNSIQKKVLDLFGSHIDSAYTSKDISKKFSMNASYIRNAIHFLKENNLIKIVGWKDNEDGYISALYQDIKGRFNEMKIHKKGYMSAYEFCQKKGKCNSSRKLSQILDKNEVEWVMASKGRGIFKGYKETDLAKAWEELTNGSTTVEQTKLDLSKGISASNLRELILSTLQKNTSKAYTIDELSRNLNLKKWQVKKAIRELRNDRKIKVVGWDLVKNQRGAIALHYQVSESELPRFKTTVDNNLYMTAQQFYSKKLRGKRVTSFKKINEEVMKKLQPIPLLINQRAYVGYPVAELKETLKKYMNADSVIPKRTHKAVKKPVAIDVETAALLSQETKGNSTNPIAKKKSLFSTISSFFKKEEVCP